MHTSIIDELRWRGLIYQESDAEGTHALLGTPGQAVYAGFDPTAASLHIGHLVPLVTLRRFQLLGHKPIALIGGATGLIGDPRGDGEERAMQTLDTVAEWVTLIQQQVERLIDFSGNSAILLDNYQWFGRLSAVELLRDIGKHFTVNSMIAKEAVKMRLAREEVGISYTEFSYMLLQAYDYLHLFDQYDCRLQLGGSEQWGNMTAGIELIRKKRSADAYAFTIPLITTAGGAKMGKTAAGAVWLDGTRTSPYALYQYFVNTDDRDVARYLQYFTLLGAEEIRSFADEVAQRPERRAAQHKLAYEVTTLIHGKPTADNVMAAGDALFGGRDLHDVDFPTLKAAITAAPLFYYPTLAALPELPELLTATGLSTSKAQARRYITAGAIYLNNAKITDAAFQPQRADCINSELLLLRKGKKNYVVISLTGE